MRVVVFGATGGTGRHLVRFLVEAGHEVTVFVRDSEKAKSLGNVQVIEGNSRNLQDVDRAVVFQDAVITALGGDSLKEDDILEQSSKNILTAMSKHRVKRLVVLGAAGALHDAQKHQTWRRKAFFWFFSRTLLKHPLRDSAAQEKQIEASETDYTIVHPPRLLDTPATGNLRVLFDGLPPNGYSISREEVAKYMVSILGDDSSFRTGPYIAY